MTLRKATLLKRVVRCIAVTGLIPVVLLAGISMFSRRPDNLGVHNGQLAACPDSPNCVSSRASDAEHRIEPIPFSGDRSEVAATLKRVIASFPRTMIVSETGDYLHAEFRSALFRFVDDVEFQIDDDAKLIHCRSASRVGYGDMGVNRQRMNAIRAAMVQER